MRRRRMSIVTVGAFSLSSLGALQAVAAPVPGFEGLYDAALSACPPAACEAAVNAYSGALVPAGIEPEVALVSFAELRAEVEAAGGGEVIDSLFEKLLPEAGMVGGAEASPI